MSSPLDSAALQRKKRRQKTQEGFSGLNQAAIKKKQSFSEFNAFDNIQSCDIGQSPKIDPRKLKGKHDDSDSDSD